MTENTELATSTAGTPAPPAPKVNAGALAKMNDGVLDNIDDIGGGNFVAVDGNQFLYKASNEVVDHLDIVVSYGKRFYQFVDEDGDNKTFHNSDTKIDNRYKLKFELRWLEDGEDGEEPTEYTMTLSTTSSMQFIDFIKKLAAAGYGIAQVIVRMTISRQVSKDGKNRYSRVEFEAFKLEDASPLGIKTTA